jgi:mono/diheme cytochrome c family protein
VVSHSNAIATIDSFSALANPHHPTPAALENGRRYYQINCAVCHGHAGAGDGMAVRYGVPAPMLTTDMTKQRTDGYIWGIMRNGRNLMPNYDRIEDADRWDVVLYVRALQGMLPGVTADTTPPGKPGETGRTVPGYTRTAPTRPAPWRPQDMTRPDSGPPMMAAPAAPRSTP